MDSSDQSLVDGGPDRGAQRGLVAMLNSEDTMSSAEVDRMRELTTPRMGSGEDSDSSGDELGSPPRSPVKVPPLSDNPMGPSTDETLRTEAAPADHASEDDAKHVAATSRRRALKSAVSKVNLVSQARGALRTMSHSEALQSLVISPNNRFKEFFDWVVVGLVLYTTVNVPLVVAYPPPLYESSFGLEVFNVIVDFVFVVDIILNFFTGYVELANGHNTIQTRPSRIRRHYLRGDFGIDLLATFPFELIIYGINAATGSSGTLNRSDIILLGFLKTPRLLRINRLLKKMEKMRAANYFRIIKSLLMLIIMAHVMGCAYYLFTDSAGNRAESGKVWIDELHEDFATRYLASLYWGVSSLLKTPVYQPMSNGERIFMCLEQLFGILLFSVIMGSVSSLIALLTAKSKQFNDKMMSVNQIVVDHGVTPHIGRMMRQYAELSLGLEASNPPPQLTAKLPPSVLTQILREKFDVILNPKNHCKLFGPIVVQNSQFMNLLLPKIRTQPCLSNEYLTRFKLPVGANLETIERSSMEMFSLEDVGKSVALVDGCVRFPADGGVSMSVSWCGEKGSPPLAGATVATITSVALKPGAEAEGAANNYIVTLDSGHSFENLDVESMCQQKSLITDRVFIFGHGSRMELLNKLALLRPSRGQYVEYVWSDLMVLGRLNANVRCDKECNYHFIDGKDLTGWGNLPEFEEEMAFLLAKLDECNNARLPQMPPKFKKRMLYNLWQELGYEIRDITNEDDRGSGCINYERNDISADVVDPTAGMIHPDSRVAIIWDTMMVIVTLVNCIYTPMALFYNIPLTESAAVLLSCIDIIFVLDVGRTFYVGYMDTSGKKPVLVMDRKKVAKNYARTWLLPDLASCIPVNILFLAVGYKANGVALLTMTRAHRLTKLNRLLKETEKWASAGYFRILKMMTYFIIFDHFVACVYFGIGVAPFNNYQGRNSSLYSWNTTAGIPWVVLQDVKEDLLSEYLASMYWGLTGLLKTPAFKPATNYERLYASMVVVTGLFVNAFLFGTIVQVINQVDEKRKLKDAKSNQVASFCENNRIPHALEQRVATYVDVQHDLLFKRTHANAQFQGLPNQLQTYVAMSQHMKLVEYSPLFNGLRKAHHPPFTYIPFTKIFVRAIAWKLVLKGDLLRKYGDRVEAEVYFVPKGRALDVVSEDMSTVEYVVRQLSVTGLGVYNTIRAQMDVDLPRVPAAELLKLQKDFPVEVLSIKAQAQVLMDADKAAYKPTSGSSPKRTSPQSFSPSFLPSSARGRSSDRMSFDKALILSGSSVTGGASQKLTPRQRRDSARDSARATSPTAMEEGVVVGDQTLPRVITSGPAMVSSPRASVEEGWEEGDLSDTDSDSGHSAKGHAHGRDICCCFDAFCDSCCCAIDPNSSYKGAWDWFMIALVFYNCLYIPVQMAFQPEDPYWLAGFDGMVDALFVVDIVLSFLTGYMLVEKGRTPFLVMDLKRIRKNYMKQWFWIDFFATFPFEVTLQLIPNGNSTASVLQYSGLLKLPRLFRLGRLLKKLEQYKKFASVIRLFKPFGLLLFVAHWVACFFWMIGMAEARKGGTNWINKNNIPTDDVSTGYCASLFWALTSLIKTPVYHPTNNQERLFITFEQIIGILLFTFVSGNVSVLIAGSDADGRILQGKINLVRKIVKHNQLAEIIKQDVRNRKVAAGSGEDEDFGEEPFKEDLPERIETYMRETHRIEKTVINDQHPIGKLMNKDPHHEILKVQYSFLIENSPFFKLGGKNTNLVNELLRNLKGMSVLCGDVLTELARYKKDIFFVPRGKVAELLDFKGKHILFISESGGFMVGKSAINIRACVDMTVMNLSHDAMMRMFKIFEYRTTLMEMMEEVTKRYERLISDQQRGTTQHQQVDTALSSMSSADRHQFKSAIGAVVSLSPLNRHQTSSSPSPSPASSKNSSRSPSPVDEEMAAGQSSSEEGNPAVLSDVILTDPAELEGAFVTDPLAVDPFAKVSWMIEHQGAFKLRWDWIILIFVIYNAIYVPYSVAFVETELVRVVVINYIIDALFLVDICFSFCTTYKDETSNGIVYHPTLVFKNYFFSLRFVVDLAATFPFELLLMSLDSAEMTPLQRLLIKAIKCIRLLRLGKVFQKLKTSERLKRFMFGFRLCAFILVCHLMGCIFFVVGKLGSHHGNNESTLPPWYERYNVEEREESYYLASLYWAFSSLLKMPCYEPGTNPERIFMSAALVLGVIVFSVLLGWVAQLIQSMDAGAKAYNDALGLANNFIYQLRLSPDLARKIQAYVEFQHMSKLKNIDSDDMLGKLSPAVRVQIKMIQFRKLIHNNIIFQNFGPDHQYEDDGRARMRFRKATVCRLSITVFLKHDYITQVGGDTCNNLFFVPETAHVEIMGKADDAGPVSASHFLEEYEVFGMFKRGVRAGCDVQLVQLLATDIKELIRLYPDEAVEFMQTVELAMQKLVGAESVLRVTSAIALSEETQQSTNALVRAAAVVDDPEAEYHAILQNLAVATFT